MFILKELAYEKDTLEPFISRETLEYHYGKHHQTYLDNLNKLSIGTEFEKLSLEDIIKTSNGALFNNAAQVWNHDFYWNCIAKNAGGKANGEIANLITRDFGSFDIFKEKFSLSASTNFGSGWTWLVKNPNGVLEIINTSNASTILTTENKALLVIDVWEHAYYIDTRNSRQKYIENFWNLVNWDFVNKNLD